MMDQKTIQILNNIHFAERYKKLYKQYSFNFNESFNDYDNQYVVKLLHEIGYTDIKYQKKENFFQSVKKVGAYRFEHKIKTKSGAVELIWDVMKNNQYYTGNSFSNLEYELLNLEERHPLPIFRNYEDLRGILTLAFQMFEDMTTEFLKVHGDST
jgi:hypothetical protein